MLDCRWRYTGRLSYDDGVALQKETVRRRVAKEIPDTLLLVEHDPVITLGKMAKQEHLLGSRLDIQVVKSTRGGDITYHGPGQIVGYPIIDLTVAKVDLKKYLWKLEEVMIRAVAAHGITAGRQEGMTGAWVGDRKIGAIGVRVEKWVTSHGFALNANNDLGGFDLIIPCGLKGKGVTSIARETGHEVDLDDLRRSVVKIFGEVVGRRMIHEA
jgi:lipoate-protein ligase B